MGPGLVKLQKEANTVRAICGIMKFQGETFSVLLGQLKAVGTKGTL